MLAAYLLGMIWRPWPRRRNPTTSIDVPHNDGGKTDHGAVSAGRHGQRVVPGLRTAPRIRRDGLDNHGERARWLRRSCRLRGSRPGDSGTGRARAHRPEIPDSREDEEAAPGNVDVFQQNLLSLFAFGNRLAFVGTVAYLIAVPLTMGALWPRHRDPAFRVGAGRSVVGAVSFLDSHLYWPRGVITKLVLAAGMGVLARSTTRAHAAEEQTAGHHVGGAAREEPVGRGMAVNEPGGRDRSRPRDALRTAAERAVDHANTAVGHHLRKLGSGGVDEPVVADEPHVSDSEVAVEMRGAGAIPAGRHRGRRNRHVGKLKQL